MIETKTYYCVAEREARRLLEGARERERERERRAAGIMGCVMSAEEKAQQQMSRRIDDELAHEMAHKRNEVKLLLLGEFNEERHAIARKERERGEG